MVLNWERNACDGQFSDAPVGGLSAEVPQEKKLAPIALKAVLTETNLRWDSCSCMRNLSGSMRRCMELKKGDEAFSSHRQKEDAG